MTTIPIPQRHRSVRELLFHGDPNTLTRTNSHLISILTNEFKEHGGKIILVST